MSISYQKLFSKMQEKGIKKFDLRTKYKINPKTVDSLVNNRSVTEIGRASCRERVWTWV